MPELRDNLFQSDFVLIKEAHGDKNSISSLKKLIG